MRQNRIQMFFLLVLVIFTGLNLLGCSHVEIKQERLSDLEYTVLSEDKLPEELKQILDEKKQNPFKMTFQDEGYLYICQGFGQQKTGGYSIQIRDAYEAENAIYFMTTLMGPLGNEPDNGQPSFPYIVVKTELRDKAVVFE